MKKGNFKKECNSIYKYIENYTNIFTFIIESNDLYVMNVRSKNKCRLSDESQQYQQFFLDLMV